MDEFLSTAWLSSINAKLRGAAAAETEGDESVCVKFEFADSPRDLPSAMTFVVRNGVAELFAGGPTTTADLVVKLSFADAELLSRGELNGGRVLREGRLKVRGDVNALTNFGSWIVAAQSTDT